MCRTGSAGAAASSLTIDASNATLSVRVDGAQSATLNLTQKTYASGAELAAEIQAQINSDDAIKASGARVSVSFVAGAYTFTSASFGSDSQVEITSAGAGSAATLGIGTATGASTAGVDVAGLIGGSVATGSGRQLTGTGVAAGAPRRLGVGSARLARARRHHGDDLDRRCARDGRRSTGRLDVRTGRRRSRALR